MAKPSKFQKITKVPRAVPSLTPEQALRRAQQNPVDVKAWKAHGSMMANLGRYDEAMDSLRRALALDTTDSAIYSTMAFVHHKRNEVAALKTCLEKALSLDPDNVQALVISGIEEQEAGRKEKALVFFERAEALVPADSQLLRNKAITLATLSRYDESLALLHRLLQKNPDSYSMLNDIANIRRDVGDFEGLDEVYQRAIALSGNDPVPYSNRLTYIHYDPAWSREAIFEVCREWQRRYAPADPPPRPVPADRSPTRRLRIGMFSDGFRNHPVGTMIVEALAHLSRKEVELYLYPSHADEDKLTARLRTLAARWQPIKHLSNEQFADLVRNDGIDILFDLSGHNSGTRSRAVALQPAPLQVKWVGGLINTTGVEAMDYLLSDAIETPPGDDEDALFVEKLIRMPDDYIVFSPPPHAPAVGPLPAEQNGYITLGCFNNPTKINPDTLREWAKLMQELPDSRLFLKGKPYTSESFRQRILAVMAAEGIEEERLIIEGPATHRGLMEAYNRVDIALDPWPYSGGLTTCEALLMGVPVVTLPGPTFAGRHSATHLVNAGLPELVVNSWEEYRARVIELAGDLESLATIRRHMRDILLRSPVCDGKRFARHLMVAIRAIWQRYCEGKTPAPLSFDKEGQAWFKGESEPVQVCVAEPESTDNKEDFNWQFTGRVMTVDNSGRLLQNRSMQLLLKTQAFGLVAFDPRSLIVNAERYAGQENVQIVPHALLGDGKPATLHACLDPELSSTLEPLPPERLPDYLRQGARVLTRLPINTLALDSIEGLGSLDWLLLDELSDAAAILEHGSNTLKNTLLLEVRIAFQPTHQRQPSLDEIIYWAGRNGLRFYHFGRMNHRGHLPQRPDLRKKQSTELVRADAIFVPDDARMAELSDEKRIKLAFLLHSIYGIRDLSYKLLAGVDEAMAEAYLRAEAFLPVAKAPEPPKEREMQNVTSLLSNDGVARTAGQPAPAREASALESAIDKADTLVHICMNHLHMQAMINAINNDATDPGVNHHFLIVRERSIPGFTINADAISNATMFSPAQDLQKVAMLCNSAQVLGVMFHGLFFDWQKQLVKLLGDQKVVVWSIMGGDLYGPVNGKVDISDVTSRLRAICTVEDGDHDLFCKHYGHKEKLPFRYVPDNHYQVAADKWNKEKLLIIGNSGDSSNNHIEILDCLSKKTDIQDYELIIPASYNFRPEYKEILCKAIAQYSWRRQIRLLEEFMDSAEYFKLLSRAEMLITAHNRQQGVGNIVASLYYGNTTILKQHIGVAGGTIVNPVWESLQAKNLPIVSFEDFRKAKRISGFAQVSKQNIEEIRNTIDAHYGIDAARAQMRAAFARIKELAGEKSGSSSLLAGSVLSSLSVH